MHGGVSNFHNDYRNSVKKPNLFMHGWVSNFIENCYYPIEYSYNIRSDNNYLNNNLKSPVRIDLHLHRWTVNTQANIW